MTVWGYVVDEQARPLTVVGWYETPEEAAAAGAGRRLVQFDPPSDSEPCSACGTRHERLPMSEDAAKVYDALFTGEDPALRWSEDDDCDMNALMLRVAETAAASLFPKP